VENVRKPPGYGEFNEVIYYGFVFGVHYVQVSLAATVRRYKTGLLVIDLLNVTIPLYCIKSIYLF